jgi:hypothetical protein
VNPGKASSNPEEKFFPAEKQMLSGIGYNSAESLPEKKPNYLKER